MALTVRQQRAINTILNTGTISETARILGVSRTAIYKWLEIDEFKRELCNAQNIIMDSAFSELKSLSVRAVDKLSRLLNSRNNHIRIRAIKMILDYGFKVRELQDLEDRVSLLELEVEKQKAKKQK